MIDNIDRILNLNYKNLYKSAIGTTLCIVVAALTSPVQALTLVQERSALLGNDQLDWSSLGKIFDPFSPNPSAFLPSSFSATSSRGLGLNVDIAPPTEAGITPPFVFQTSPPPTGVPTNFASGDFALFTGFRPGSFPAPGNPGPITITFNKPVKSAGTQINVDDTPEFTAFISAFDSANNLLGTFSTPGTSSLALDNSAVFLGMSSDTANISRLVFSTSIPNRAVAINTISIATVPEPASTLGLLVVGVWGAGLMLKGKYQQTV
ncbi:PEP-CTERM sorting domain-containing protein [Brunnivagina elsteri]|uniref:PEP-CTERM sorting domain-containing protein n=1 Tax=Brunnivagina elsteri CCALA 953 TaxID=987040 RepID=A0A2A2TMW3_9CYAN|nr:PEP-CTERM sorting domain-containing protein [Calothrix elsteri]PAX59790.1 hypothetical protein CK510_05275 [Calothrix elsteri CCALA 953]